MKEYTVEIEIALPRDRVIELFDNPDNLFKWQTGLQSFEHISGELGRPAISQEAYGVVRPTGKQMRAVHRCPRSAGLVEIAERARQ